MKRKFAFFLAGVMMLTCLVGCAGEEDTAESLIDKALNNDFVAYRLQINAEKEDAQYSYDFDYECGLNVYYMEGNIKTDGSTVRERYYYALEDGKETKYSYDTDEKAWFKTVNNVDKEGYKPELSSNMFRNLEMEVVNDGYEVTGEVKKIEAYWGPENDYYTELVEEIQDFDAKVTFKFNEYQELESYVIDVEADEADYTKLEIIYTIDELSDDIVKVPSRVSDNARVKSSDTADKMGVSLGVITDTTYENEYFGIGWESPNSNWILFSREQVDSIYNTTINNFGDDYQSALENAASFIDMCAQNYAESANVNVGMEKLPGLASAYTESDYASVTAKAVISAYESMGFENITTSTGTVEVLGETHASIFTEYTYLNTPFYIVQGVVKSNSYIIIITSGSNISFEDAIANLDYFFWIAE